MGSIKSDGETLYIGKQELELLEIKLKNSGNPLKYIKQENDLDQICFRRLALAALYTSIALWKFSKIKMVFREITQNPAVSQVGNYGGFKKGNCCEKLIYGGEVSDFDDSTDSFTHSFASTD